MISLTLKLHTSNEEIDELLDMREADEGGIYVATQTVRMHGPLHIPL